MTRILLTLASGASHQRYLDLTAPSHQAFAEKHGWEYINHSVVNSARPASWWKVPLLKAALEDGCGEALWVDADVLIVDDTDDIDAPVDAWQALVRHHTLDGEVPNCGVWLVREPMLDVLDRVWRGRQVHHGWWEQAAVMDLLGYRHSNGQPAYLAERTELYERTWWLDNGWNYHLWDNPAPEHVRFAHASMFKDREQILQSWLDHGVADRSPTPCGHRYPILDCTCFQHFNELAVAAEA